MKELAEIVTAWEAVCAAGGEALLATVVGVSGSTYRRPGARMLLSREGRLAGSVSGGCLEGDILQKAWWRTEVGAALVTYDSTDSDEDVVWGFGLGCNGVVQVLLERVSPERPGPLNALTAVLRERRPQTIITVTASDDPAVPLGTAPPGWTPPDGVSVFQETVQPPAPLVIFGAGQDALPLVRLTKELGWHVTVADTRGTRARPERFPQADAVCLGWPETMEIDKRTAAVVMTHNYLDDRRVLQSLLLSSAGYIGQLGPRVRTERLLAEIADDGLVVTEEMRRRLHAPIGLDLGADNPEEIALSIVAEIQAARTDRDGGSLRNRRAPLHARPETALTAGPRREAVCLLSA